MFSNIFVFDIETVIDNSLVCQFLDMDEETSSPQEIRKAIEDYHLEITAQNNSFPRQLFHKVVAISFLHAEVETFDNLECYHIVECRSGAKEESSEAELIAGFFNHLKKYPATLVTYNGRTFDLPVLRYRAMRHDISIPWLYKTGDKWNNYLQRYSANYHCDLLDVLSDYGASARVKLDEVCSLLNVPGKLDAKGSDVAELYDQGMIKEIRDYCETDVLSTWLVFIANQYHRGIIDKDAYEMAKEQTYDILLTQKKEKPNFAKFLARWQELGYSL